MVTKRTAIVLYAAVLLVPGLGVFLLGHLFATAPSVSSLAGAGEFAATIKQIGAALSAAGIVGLGWGLSLSNNPTLPGYAGLTERGLVAFLVPLLLVGPLWMLVGWTLWLIPAFRARS